MNELVEATDDINKGEELTDIAWYASNYANLIEFNVDSKFYFQENFYYFALPRNNYAEMLMIEISKLTDHEKKMFAYKKDIKYAVLEEQLLLVMQRLNDCYTAFNINPFISMQRNIDKLKARFPDKFSEQKANSRDLKKERKILEGK